MAFKDFLHAEAGGPHDLVIAVDKCSTEAVRRLLADRGFADAHHADKRDSAFQPTAAGRRGGWRGNRVGPALRFALLRSHDLPCFTKPRLIPPEASGANRRRQAYPCEQLQKLDPSLPV